MRRVTLIPSHEMTLFGPRITVFTKDGRSYTRQATGREFIWDFEEEARRIRDVVPGLPIPAARFEEIIATCRGLDGIDPAHRLVELPSTSRRWRERINRRHATDGLAATAAGSLGPGSAVDAGEFHRWRRPRGLCWRSRTIPSEVAGAAVARRRRVAGRRPIREQRVAGAGRLADGLNGPIGNFRVLAGRLNPSGGTGRRAAKVWREERSGHAASGCRTPMPHRGVPGGPSAWGSAAEPDAAFVLVRDRAGGAPRRRRDVDRRLGRLHARPSVWRAGRGRRRRPGGRVSRLHLFGRSPTPTSARRGPRRAPRRRR